MPGYSVEILQSKINPGEDDREEEGEDKDGTQVWRKMREKNSQYITDNRTKDRVTRELKVGDIKKAKRPTAGLTDENMTLQRM